MHDQIQLIDVIYAAAEVTIITDTGEGPDFGLPVVGSTPRNLQTNFKVGDMLIIHRDYSRLDISRGNHFP